MTDKPPEFRDSDERDDLRIQVRALTTAAALLPLLTRDLSLMRYRLSSLETTGPMLPSVANVARAKQVLEQAAECLKDYYRQRVRYDDEPDPWRETDGSLDDEVPL